MSVWDHPRPPAVVPDRRHVLVVLDGEVVCDTRAALRVLETSHPPTWYLPRADWGAGALRPAGGGSWCEWKGAAAYLDVVGGGRTARAAAWTYPDPAPAYAVLRDHVAVYAGRVDRVTVDGEEVEPQPGGCYGGWVTRDVAGPVKGGPGTAGW